MHQFQQVLPHVLGEILRQGPLSAAKLNFAWKTVVGPAIARVTTVERLDSGILEVEASTQHWRREIKRSAPMILDRLTALLGPDAITGIRVVHDARCARTPARKRDET
jgi:predicted nucleic acid-binding Zn ribbon protein